MDDIECAGYTFGSNFDSGNLAKVQLVRCLDIDASDKLVSAEFNLWTRPDCAGTEYENLNRSWFYFSIQGGAPNRICKLNVMNLNKQVKLFSQGMHPAMRVGDFGKWERTKDNPTYTADEVDFVISFLHTPGENVNTKYYYAFTFPFTYTECQNSMDRFDRLFKKGPNEVSEIIEEITAQKNACEVQTDSSRSVRNESNSRGVPSTSMKYISDSGFDNASTTNSPTESDRENDIYYHRELLVKSVEGRRVDLLTISSFHGIQCEREPRLLNLFPSTVDRCHSFKDKKVIFISSRVHPGETPASFVLNGFLKMILDKKNKYAIILRRMFVFKIVPFLNPDGVYNGCYRTDTLGQNLNRVYLAPTLDKQPSIYAVQKLIRYYHDKTTHENPPGMQAEKSQECNENDSSENSCDAESSASMLSTADENIGNARKIRSPKFTVDKIALKIVNKNEKPTGPYKFDMHNSSACCSSVLKVSENDQSVRGKSGKKPLRKDSKFTKLGPTLSDKPSKINRISKFCLRNRSNTMPMKTNINISSDFLPKNVNSETHLKEQSNMFLYIDLHGHASKKGIFMYGNHLPNVSEAVECMLLPRLMSLNCQHFHFDACVFSEKNMYHKGKRDGLSKEGSGRVAIYKMIGLIKSYTLEGNYNTGKYVNMLPPRYRENSPKRTSHAVPKYTPMIFEEVGRALGPSILDLSNSNPTSRLQNSEFHSLQGLRNALRTEIDKKVSQSMMISKVPSHTRIRPTSSTSSCYFLSKSDILKENKTKTVNSKFNTSYSKIERHRLGRKLDSQQVPSKRSKLLSAKSMKLDTEKSSNSLASESRDIKLLDKGKVNLKVPLKLQRRNSFGGIGTRKDAAMQPSTSRASTSFESDVPIAHCSAQSSFSSVTSIKSKSSITNFRRRKSKRLVETRSISASKGSQIKVKNALIQKKRTI